MWAAGEPKITKRRGINKLHEMEGRKTTASTTRRGEDGKSGEKALKWLMNAGREVREET